MKWIANSFGCILGIVISVLIFDVMMNSLHADSATATKTESALQMVAQAVDKLEKNTFAPMNSQKIIYGGIQGMFRTLDPYSQFLDEDVFSYMQAQQQGSFFGIGVSFDIKDGQLMVIAPIEDSPAWKLGIQPGDIIVEIEGESTVGITSADVLKKLRGQKGSKVNIAVKRYGHDEPIHFEIVRDKINLTSVRGGFLLDDQTGYVRLTEFSATSASELLDALYTLKSKGMKQLILDLRFNGGGLLNAADDVSSLFLKKGALIVSTKGRNPDNQMELAVKQDGTFIDLPLIVLVNESSASASEIVAGTIQDHDRGLIVGTTTHGKGLVGSQIPSRLGTAVQITSAQYFTASGRFIQKPFSIPHRKSLKGEGTMLNAEGDKSIHYTEKGRKVFGGGGITPDVIIQDSTQTPTYYMIENRRLFFDFAVQHGESLKPITPELIISDAVYDMFLAYCEEQKVPISTSEIEKDKEAIKVAIKRELLNVFVNTTVGEKIRVENLNIVQEALKLFPKLSTILASDSTETRPVN